MVETTNANKPPANDQSAELRSARLAAKPNQTAVPTASNHGTAIISSFIMLLCETTAYIFCRSLQETTPAKGEASFIVSPD
jgi:hypothetical protein